MFGDKQEITSYINNRCSNDRYRCVIDNNSINIFTKYHGTMCINIVIREKDEQFTEKICVINGLNVLMINPLLDYYEQEIGYHYRTVIAKVLGID